MDIVCGGDALKINDKSRAFKNELGRYPARPRHEKKRTPFVLQPLQQRPRAGKHFNFAARHGFAIEPLLAFRQLDQFAFVAETKCDKNITRWPSRINGVVKIPGHFGMTNPQRLDESPRVRRDGIDQRAVEIEKKVPFRRIYATHCGSSVTSATGYW